MHSLAPCRQFFQEQYQQLNDQLFSCNRAAFPEGVFSYHNFVWAVATVRSRLHPPLDSEQPALVPVADLVSLTYMPAVHKAVLMVMQYHKAMQCYD